MDELPVRHISRLAGEMHLSGIDALTRLSPCADEDGVVALVVLRVCLPDWIASGRPAVPPELRLATTLRALSRSLAWPISTTHKIVKRLIGRGVLARGANGLFVPRTATDLVIGYLEQVHDLLLRFAEDVHRSGALHARARSRAVHPIGAVLAVGMDIMLVPFETFRDQLGDWTAKKIWIAASTLTVRHVTSDSELSARFAVASTPDDERRAVSAAHLRGASRTSLSTTWRRLKAMEAKGVMAQRDGGWLVRSEQLLDPDVEASVRAGVDYYLRRLNELVAAGLDLTSPPYLHARPRFLEVR